MKTQRGRWLTPGVVFCLILAAPVQIQAQSKSSERIAVLNLRAGRDIDPKLAAALSELTMSHVQSLGLGECIGASDIRALLNLEQSKQLLTCDEDASCVAEIGGALGVERMMTGSLSRIGSQYLITLKLFDVTRARVLARSSKQVPADEDELLEAIPGMVLQLFGQAGARGEQNLIGANAAGNAVLVVRSDPSGSTVRLAGREVGQTPLRVPDLALGTYELQISHRDYSTHLQQITLLPGQDTIVEATLEIDRALAISNYAFVKDKAEKRRFWERIWGVGHVACGLTVASVGSLVVLGSLRPPQWFGLGVGALVATAGIGWLSFGVVKLLNLPEIPPPPYPEEKEQPVNADPSSQPASTQAADKVLTKAS